MKLGSIVSADVVWSNKMWEDTGDTDKETWYIISISELAVAWEKRRK